MQDFRTGEKSTERLVRVFLNKQDDYIMLNQDDASFFDKYTKIVKWLEEKQAQYSKSVGAWEKKYKGRKIFEETENGDIHIDSEQLSDFSEMRVTLYKECCQKIDELFGEGTTKKYFRAIYEEIPDFIPDEKAIYDFFDEMSPIVSGLFSKRMDGLKSNYGRNRKGKHTKTKEDLIAEYKEKTISDV